MHDIFSQEPDPLDGMLRPPSPPDNETLRQTVYTRTRRVLHRRRLIRRFAYAAALLMSFAAGVLSTRFVPPAPAPAPEVVVTPPKEPKSPAFAAVRREPKSMGPLAERIRKALQTPIKVDYKEVAFADVLKNLEKKAPGLSIRNLSLGDNIKVSLHFEEELPVSAVLQALADFYEMRFFVRDYGIVLATARFPLPPGALTIEEFLRQKPAEKK